MPFRMHLYLVFGLAISLISACGGGGSSSPAPDSNANVPNANVPNALRPLLGTITLIYKFNFVSSIFTNSSTFTSSSLSNDKTALVASSTPSGTMACSVAPVGSGRQFLCLIVNRDSSMDAFAFDINFGNISGIYAYCSVGTTTGNCGAKLGTSPSGTVTGNVAAAAAATSGSSDAVAAIALTTIENTKAQLAASMPYTATVGDLEQQSIIDSIAAQINVLREKSVGTASPN